MKITSVKTINGVKQFISRNGVKCVACSNGRYAFLSPNGKSTIEINLDPSTVKNLVEGYNPKFIPIFQS